MTLEPDKFQVQLGESPSSFRVYCSKCTEIVDPREDSECVIIWPASKDAQQPLYFHIICYGEALSGMVEFFKVFIVEKRKKRVLQ